MTALTSWISLSLSSSVSSILGRFLGAYSGVMVSGKLDTGNESKVTFDDVATFEGA